MVICRWYTGGLPGHPEWWKTNQRCEFLRYGPKHFAPPDLPHIFPLKKYVAPFGRIFGIMMKPAHHFRPLDWTAGLIKEGWRRLHLGYLKPQGMEVWQVKSPSTVPTAPPEFLQKLCLRHSKPVDFTQSSKRNKNPMLEKRRAPVKSSRGTNSKRNILRNKGYTVSTKLFVSLKHHSQKCQWYHFTHDFCYSSITGNKDLFRNL